MRFILIYYEAHELQDIGYGSIENAKSKAAAFEKVPSLVIIHLIKPVQKGRNDRCP
jgi:hypothetical protein